MRKKIAILGGGMSSLVTAYELSSLPDFHAKYELTVYQNGWRLGGKGASGRNPKDHDRIEEHGLHLLFGFYDNALGIMRQLYDELGRKPGEALATFDDAFKPHNFIVMMEQHKGQWLPWKLDPIPNPLSPGGDGFLKPWDYIKRVLEWCLEIIHNYILHTDGVKLLGFRSQLAKAAEVMKIQVHQQMDRKAASASSEGLLSAASTKPESGAESEPESGAESEPDSELSELVRTLHQQGIYPEQMAERAASLAPSSSTFSSLWWIELELIRLFLDSISDAGAVVHLIGKVLEHLWRLLFDADTVLRRTRMILDLAFATVRGLIDSRIIFPPYDWFGIDNYDLVSWLRKYGANEATLRSPLIFAMKDAAYHGYTPIGAGTILHAMLRMLFTYRGSILYKMQAGMGDTIFTPLYEVLKKRGVRFEFFHAVRNIELSADKRSVAKIHIGRQATPKTGSYDPLIQVKGLPSWPSTPLFDQLVEGKLIQDGGFDLEDFWTKWKDVDAITLEAGKDFDQVVLGISIGAFPFIAKELIDANPRFAAMTSAVKTTQTLGVQLWLKPDLKELGWELSSPVVIPYVEPLDTWADMTHLLSHESWPAGSVKNLAYLTSAMQDNEPIPPRSDHGYPWRQTERVKQYTIDFLTKDIEALWPNSVDAKGEFDWSLLAAPATAVGKARADHQYYRAPLSPSERYVLAVPGSSAKRLRAEESGFANLILTGDWTKTALSIGCLEAATMAGIMSARAIDRRIPKAKHDWLADLPPAATPVPPTPVAQYVNIDGQLLGIPPVDLDVDVSMFLLPADYGKLRQICDTQLNLGGDTIYKPIGPFVVMYASKLNNYPKGNPIGYVPELDYGIWIPLLAGKKIGPFFKPERVVTYTPYIWVDNGIALIGGRTVFGFLKNIGQMTFPASAKDTKSLSLSTQVLPKYGVNQKVVERKLIEVRRKPFSLLTEVKSLWEGTESLLDAFGASIDGLLHGNPEVPLPSFQFIRDLLSGMSAGMRMVYLKQFPEITDARLACYQAITECDVPITGGLKGGLLFGQYSVDIYRYESHQLVKTLGLYPVESDADKDTMMALAQGWANFKAVVENGTIIWKASIP